MSEQNGNDSSSPINNSETKSSDITEIQESIDAIRTGEVLYIDEINEIFSRALNIELREGRPLRGKIIIQDLGDGLRQSVFRFNASTLQRHELSNAGEIIIKENIKAYNQSIYNISYFGVSDYFSESSFFLSDLGFDADPTSTDDTSLQSL